MRPSERSGGLMFSLAYFTNRRDPKIEWMFRSLRREIEGKFAPAQIIVIDYHADDEGRREWLQKIVEKEYGGRSQIVHSTPKPCAWQGKYRKTKENHFAASNARNTAFALCSEEYIACVDDLSVFATGWYDQVRHAAIHGYIALGAYKKVKNLSVAEDGSYTFEEFPPGTDSRWGRGANGIVKADGSWMYGCSFALPIQAAIDVNGFNEKCDGTGMEDVEFGIRLHRKGYKFFYNRNMLTYESEEHHHDPGNEKFTRQSIMTTTGVMSDWVIYNNVTKTSMIRADGNHFDLRELRENCLNGVAFPDSKVEMDWRTGKPLREL